VNLAMAKHSKRIPDAFQSQFWKTVWICVS
jgi:hypothetical protein